MRGILLKVKKNKGFRAALCTFLALMAMACVALAVILLPKTGRVTFAATDEDTLVSAINSAAAYGSTETEIKIENDITVDSEKLTVTAGKTIRLTGEGILTFEKPLDINAEAQLTFDVETAFNADLTVYGTLTVNSRLYNTAALTVANSYFKYAEIPSEGLIIGGSLNNDTSKGGTIKVEESATLKTLASTTYTVTQDANGTKATYSNNDGGAIMLKANGDDLGLTVEGNLENGGSIIYDNKAEKPVDSAVAVNFVEADTFFGTEDVNDGVIEMNDGIYALYADNPEVKISDSGAIQFYNENYDKKFESHENIF